MTLSEFKKIIKERYPGQEFDPGSLKMGMPAGAERERMQYKEKEMEPPTHMKLKWGDPIQTIGDINQIKTAGGPDQFASKHGLDASKVKQAIDNWNKKRPNLAYHY